MPSIDNNSLWESVLAELQLSLSNANFQTWFKDKTTLLSSGSGLVEIGCASPYSKVWIEERYLGTLKEIVDRLTETSNTLTFTVAPSIKPAAPSKKRGGRQRGENPTVPLFESEATDTLNDSLQEANINKRYSFSNFVVGSSNQLAYAVAQAIVDSPFDRYNPLLIFGGVGVGKTHLLQSIGQAVLLRRAKIKVLYCSSETFTNDMVEAIQKRSTSAFRNKYRSVDLLLVDDIQFIAGRESTQEQFFHTFNELHGHGKQIVLSCDRDPKDIDGLQERLKNRFAGGLVTKIDPPDLELREAVLLVKARREALTVGRPVIRALAENLGPSIRELEGGLLRAAAVAKLTGKAIDLSLVESVILAGRRPDKTLETTLEEIAAYFSLSAAQLRSPSRCKEYVFPRQVAMYLIRKETKKSFNDIARLFGGKDHTTVIYSTNKVETLVEKSGETARIIREVRAKVFKS